MTDGSPKPGAEKELDALRERVAELEGLGAENKQTEEALRDSEQRFRELAEMFPEVIFETNLKGDLTFVSRRGYEVFGYSVQDFERGINALDIIALQERERARRTSDVCSQGRRSVRTNTRGLLEGAGRSPS